MAFDAFLKIEGIPGESRDDRHINWIEILSYSHAIAQPQSGSPGNAGGGPAERCDHGVFVIVKPIDQATPKLSEACCDGRHIPSVTLSLNRAGGDKVQYMTYKMSEVLVSSVRPGGSAKGGEALPLEEITFSYGRIEWTYTKQKREDGTGGGVVAAGWDVSRNKRV